MGRVFIDRMEMKINASRTDLLATLKENRKRHTQILAEAREGYRKQAVSLLTERLQDLECGKIVPLGFRLSPPTDYTAAYNIAIKMTELHQGDTIELSPNEVRSLIMDEWDWMEQFLLSNAGVSATAATYASEKGMH